MCVLYKTRMRMEMEVVSILCLVIVLCGRDVGCVSGEMVSRLWGVTCVVLC